MRIEVIQDHDGTWDVYDDDMLVQSFRQWEPAMLYARELDEQWEDGDNSGNETYQ
jgi:hypothetical protein